MRVRHVHTCAEPFGSDGACPVMCKSGFVSYVVGFEAVMHPPP